MVSRAIAECNLGRGIDNVTPIPIEMRLQRLNVLQLAIDNGVYFSIMAPSANLNIPIK